MRLSKDGYMSHTKTNSTRKITVYQASPEWDRYAKPFLMPVSLLTSLFVAEYMIHDSNDCEECYSLGEHHPDIQAIRKDYPGTVLVY
jgi:hypothetical protein